MAKDGDVSNYLCFLRVTFAKLVIFSHTASIIALKNRVSQYNPLFIKRNKRFRRYAIKLEAV